MCLEPKKDNFKKKYALICCNETYRTKAGLPNLPKTKNDLADIRRTVKMLNIKNQDVIELVDASHDQVQEAYEKLNGLIIAEVTPLVNATMIGTNG